jgi:hypothetical protein
MIAVVIRESIVEFVLSGLMVAGVLSAFGLFGMAVAKIWSWLRAAPPASTVRIEIHIRS